MSLERNGVRMNGLTRKCKADASKRLILLAYCQVDAREKTLENPGTFDLQVDTRE